MFTRTLAATALVGLMMSPAFAQSGMSSPSTSPAPGSSATPSATMNSEAFVQSQTSSDWLASKLIGTNVYGPDNAKIGDVSDVLLDNAGATRAVVIGVGGFLGVGQKDVAIPFNALTVTRTAAGDKIEKISVKYTKDQLKNAPSFTHKQASNMRTAPDHRG